MLIIFRRIISLYPIFKLWMFSSLTLLSLLRYLHLLTDTLKLVNACLHVKGSTFFSKFHLGKRLDVRALIVVLLEVPWKMNAFIFGHVVIFELALLNTLMSIIINFYFSVEVCIWSLVLFELSSKVFDHLVIVEVRSHRSVV